MKKDLLKEGLEFSNKYSKLLEGASLEGIHGIKDSVYSLWLDKVKLVLTHEYPDNNEILDEFEYVSNINRQFKHVRNFENHITPYAYRHKEVMTFLLKYIKQEKQMNIALSTRRNIIDSFLITKIPWYGELEQNAFLGRMFNLQKLPSFDSRYTTADEDIVKHTIMNDDWPDEWVFTDRRFNLLHLPDEQFLEFLELTVHPVVRQSEDQITTLVEIYNNNLKDHDLKLVKTTEIAGKPVYSTIKIEPETEDNGDIVSENRIALVVGIADYEHAGTLSNPINDSEDIENKLTGLGFKVIRKTNLGLKELKIAIDEFGEELQNHNVCLFYFAGHAVQVSGKNYLFPIDANPKSERHVEYDCVDVNRILKDMEYYNTRTNIIILDACRDNPFERSWSRGVKQRGLAQLNAAKGTLIGYATQPGNTASDGYGRNGLYTSEILNHIDVAGSPITSMFQKVRTEVMKRSKDKQVPWESTSLTGEFYFKR